MRTRRLSPSAALLAAVASIAGPFVGRALAEDVSAPAILSWFDGTFATQERRAADVFAAGYGAVWLPPPGRADSGNQSVGYDVYDRFDLGSAGNPTLYGTETGLRTLAKTFDKINVDTHIDLVWNHNGFRDESTTNFLAQGGYPGFVLRNPDGTGGVGIAGTTGDFHSGERLAGLIDIDHASNIQIIRNPTTAGDSRNIPAGTVANKPNVNNARYYTDTDGAGRSLYDPRTGESFTRYNFNTAAPLTGDAVPENVTGYLQRYTQWLVQSVGVDGFRIDAAKDMPGWVLNYYDRAVYEANPRKLLDGSTAKVFAYSEVFTSDREVLLHGFDNTTVTDDYVRKDLVAGSGTVGGNRDVLDFNLRDALASNLTSNGFVNDWRNVVSAGLDVYDDGKHNGSTGVMFVGSHDQGPGADLNTVAYAYTLTQPGNAIVYLNGKEHGTGRDFPKDGRGDALGGQYGSAITTLSTIRDTHGRGDYRERYLTKENLAYERSGSMLVMLSNRNDAGASDYVNMAVDLPYGTPLIELTGNAKANGLSEVVTVTNDYFNGPSYVRAKFLYSGGADKGYLVYGLSGPQGSLALSNVAQTLAPDAATADTNGSARVSSVRVIKSNAFDVTLNTNAVNLLGTIRDRDADGDNALVRIDGGLDLNGNGHVDNVAPGDVAYGFESFTNASNGYGNASGNGTYSQSIDATQLSEGYHFVEVRAFRHRSDGGAAIYTPFKETIYVDRLKPVSATSTADFRQFDTTNTKDRDLYITSTDQTADRVYAFANLGAALTDAQVLALVGTGNQADQVDRDVFKKYFSNVANGNNALTVVTIEITGTTNVQRFAAISPATSIGFGLGDLTFDKYLEGDDLNAFVALYKTNNQQFNAAADLNGDGMISSVDWQLLGVELQQIHDAGTRGPNGTSPLVSQGTLDYYHSLGSQIPEPTTLAASLGAAGVVLRRRRRNVRQAV